MRQRAEKLGRRCAKSSGPDPSARRQRLGGGTRRRHDHDRSPYADGLADVGALVEIGAGVIVLDDVHARVNENRLGTTAVAALVVIDLNVGDPGTLGASGGD